MGAGDFYRAKSEAELRSLFEQSRADLQTLVAINTELCSRLSDDAGDLQIEVAQTIVALKKSGEGHQAAQQQPVGEWLRAFLLTRGLSRPDGRPLFRYRMTDAEYAEANRILRLLAVRGRFAEPDERAARLFVAFCAEWFRREAASMFNQWNELAPDVFPSVPYSSKQRLTEMGLHYWGRELVVTEHAREFLLTLGHEGGIPIHVVTDRDRGWLNAYLRKLLRSCADDISEESVRRAAYEEAYLLRASYRYDQFVDACAELVQRLLHWRKVAETEAPQVDSVAYLDACHPHWRGELPVYVPKESHQEVQILLKGLMTEQLTGLATSGVQVNRYLELEHGAWRPAIQIVAEGDIRRDKLPGLAADSRYRAVASGELSNFIADGFALFEPPVDEQRTWKIRPLVGLSRLFVGFPFRSAVSATLTSGSVAYDIVWPSGESVRSDVLVFQEEDGKGSERLRLVRQGSASLPAKVLYALVPQTWVVEADNPEAILENTIIEDLSCRLVKTDGTLYLSAPEDIGGFRYRVEAGKDQRVAELKYTDSKRAGLMSNDPTLDLFEAPLRVKILEEERLRLPGEQEVYWRRPGQLWQEVREGCVRELGLLEVSWRDPRANIQLEKRCVGLLPVDARIQATMTNAQRGEIRLVNMPGWTLSISRSDIEVTRVSADLLSFVFPARPAYRISGQLHAPVGRPIPIEIALPARDATIVRADGSVVSPGSNIDLAGLRGMTALSPHRTHLLISKRGSRSQGPATQIDDGHAFPIYTRRLAIEGLLADAGHQDAQVELAFLGDGRPPIRLSRYRFERPELKGRVVALPEVGGRVVARMVCRPETEIPLIWDTAVQGYPVPDDCYGPTLVYMRDGPDVLSRPLLVDNKQRDFERPDGIMSAITELDHRVRNSEICRALTMVATGEAGPGDVKYLINHVTALEGVPASAFDVLARLSENPAALLRVLLNAPNEAARQAIWRLQSELPFLWLSLPIAAWQEAFGTEWAGLEKAFASLEDAVRSATIMTGLTNIAAQISSIDEALPSILSRVGFVVEDPSKGSRLGDIAQAYVRSQSDAGRGEAVRAEMPDLSHKLAAVGLPLPPEIQSLSFQDWGGLLAPAFLALSCLGRLPLDEHSKSLVRHVMRDDQGANFPYIPKAFPHFLNFYGA